MTFASRASMKKKTPLKNQVVVITGASSGNGRAAAVEFAKAGASVVLAARRMELLREVAIQCENFGGRALPIQTDVTRPEELKNLKTRALEHFGRIDVWINNAGIGAVGALNETPLESHVRVISTNLLGAVYGTHAVLPYFKERKKGIIISTNSVGTFVPLPYSCAYSASKFGLRGFLEAVRAEVSNEPNIQICEVFPAFLKTPGIQHVGNYVGKKLKNPIGAGDPLRVARTMVKLAQKPKNRSPVMALTQVARMGYFLFPKFTRWTSARFFDFYFKHAESVEMTDGTLFTPEWTGRGVYADPEASTGFTQ